MDNIKHLVSTWDSRTQLYTCVCGYQSKENIKTALSSVTCLDCLRLTVKRQSDEIQGLRKFGNMITNFKLKE